MDDIMAKGGGSADDSVEHTARRTPLIIFSPLPPRRNGIADYCAEMLPGLQRRFDCTVVVEDGSPGIGLASVPTIQMTDYENRGDLASAPHLFHVGNNPDHVYMLPILARVPGLIVLHDPGLHHLLDTATLGKGDTNAYVAALQSEFGWAGRRLATQFVRYGLREPRMHVVMPMIRGIVGPARGVIVHSSSAAQRVRLQCPDVHIHIVPHHVLPPPPAAVSLGRRMRSHFGIGPKELLLLSLGFVTPAKQIDLILRALADGAASLPSFRYLIAGEQSYEGPDVMGLARELGIADRVILTGYVPAEDITGLISAADVFLNLRYPTLGETSGTLMRAMAHGTPAIVNNVGSFKDFPEEIVARIPWGRNTQTLLLETLHRLAHDVELRRKIGNAAAKWSLLECSLEGSIKAYDTAIRAMGKPKLWSATPYAWETHPLASLMASTRSASTLTTPLWYTAGLAPTPVGACQVLAILTEPAERQRLVEWLGRPADLTPDVPEQCEAWSTLLKGAPRRSVDLLLISVPCAILPCDLGPVLRRLNYLLSFGGILVLELDASANSTNNTLTQEHAGQQALELAGFDVEATIVAPPVNIYTPIEITSSRRCWKAIKISEFCTPSPSAAR